jgi:stress-induced-phosphoprotein 1
MLQSSTPLWPLTEEEQFATDFKEPSPVPLTQNNKAAADAEKMHGNTAYKQRNFHLAISHYRKAWLLNNDVTYLTNLSAAYFECGDYKNSIISAVYGIETGKKILTEPRIIAKSVPSKRMLI